MCSDEVYNGIDGFTTSCRTGLFKILVLLGHVLFKVMLIK